MSTGVWVGNDDNSPTRGVTGGTLPAQIWKSAMLTAEKGLPLKPLDRSPPQPPNEPGLLSGLFSSGPSGAAPGDDEVDGRRFGAGRPAAPNRRRSAAAMAAAFWAGCLATMTTMPPPPPPPYPSDR